MIVAITPYKPLNLAHIEHYQSIEEAFDLLLLRTPMTDTDLISWIREAIEHGIPKHKIMVHSNLEVLEHCELDAIHFAEMDERAITTKAMHPQLTVSMSTHSLASIDYAKHAQLDFVFFSHIFKTSSKPGKAPRSTQEIKSAINHPMSVIALGGINMHTLPKLPKGFDGIAAITLFEDATKVDLLSIKQEWSNE